MLDIFITVDTEIGCGGWDDIDRKFPCAFKKYVYGPIYKGDFGLPYQVKLLTEHGLTGVFFVEPLFCKRSPNMADTQPRPLHSSLLKTGQRKLEQAYLRRFQ